MTAQLPDWSLAPIDGEAMRIWSQALNDDNPIHLDQAAAAALGYGPARVNPGPANLACLVNMVLATQPAESIVAIEASFMGNVLENDAVHASGTIDEQGVVTAVLTRASDGAPVVAASIATAR